MNLSVSCAFDGGNIRLVAIEGNRVDLEIVKDHQSDFYQWFYFRLTGAGGQPVELRLLNCAGAAYPHGWENYRACMSEDREDWERVDTSYEGGILTIRATPPPSSAWFAYFAPYTMERHHDLGVRDEESRQIEGACGEVARARITSTPIRLIRSRSAYPSPP